MTAAQMGAEELTAIIAAALHDRDFKAVAAALRLLALEDPHRAAAVHQTLLLVSGTSLQHHLPPGGER